MSTRLRRCSDCNFPIGNRDKFCPRCGARQPLEPRRIATLVIGLCVSGSALAYPERPVRLVVTFPAGGGIDLIARTVAQKLTDAWSQQIVIDNRAGGGGVIGTEIVARAAPDGYNLLIASGTGFIINPLLMAKLPYDPFRDFSPVTMMAINPTILCVHPSLPVTTVKELIMHARAKPRQLNYASAGPGSPIHLGMELFKSITATDLVHVPYKGAVPAVTDLLAGQVQVMLNTMPTMLPHVKTGKLRALAVGSARRARATPELATMAEAGVPGFEAVAWAGLAAPEKTPATIINKLNQDVARVLNDADVIQRLAAQGAETLSSTPDGFARFMREESARARKVIVAAGIKPE